MGEVTFDVGVKLISDLQEAYTRYSQIAYY